MGGKDPVLWVIYFASQDLYQQKLKWIAEPGFKARSSNVACRCRNHQSHCHPPPRVCVRQKLGVGLELKPKQSIVECEHPMCCVNLCAHPSMTSFCCIVGCSVAFCDSWSSPVDFLLKVMMLFMPSSRGLGFPPKYLDLMYVTFGFVLGSFFSACSLEIWL